MLRVAGVRRVIPNRKYLQCTFPECSKKFHAQSGLTQHILRKHRIPPDQLQAPLESSTSSSGQANSQGENYDMHGPEYNTQFMVSDDSDDARNFEEHGVGPGMSETLLGLMAYTECNF